MNDKCTPYQDTLYCAVTVHTVNTIWNTSESMLKLILTYEVNRAAWLKGIYLIQSRGRHFSPSLPARRSTQGRGTTGIWNSAKSISELQAENLGWIAPRTTYRFLYFCLSITRHPFISFAQSRTTWNEYGTLCVSSHQVPTTRHRTWNCYLVNRRLSFAT